MHMQPVPPIGPNVIITPQTAGPSLLLRGVAPVPRAVLL